MDWLITAIESEAQEFKRYRGRFSLPDHREYRMDPVANSILEKLKHIKKNYLLGNAEVNAISEIRDPAMLFYFERKLGRKYSQNLQEKINSVGGKKVEILKLYQQLSPEMQHDLSLPIKFIDDFLKRFEKMKKLFEELEKHYPQEKLASAMRISLQFSHPIPSGVVNAKVSFFEKDQETAVKDKRLKDMVLNIINAYKRAGSEEQLKKEIRLMVEKALDRSVGPLRQTLKGRLNINVIFKVVPYEKEVLAFVGRVFAMQGSNAKITSYDPQLRNFEINVNEQFFFKCLKFDDYDDFTSVIVHEFTHTLDGQLNRRKAQTIKNAQQIIRDEGVATFGQFVFSQGLQIRDDKYSKQVVDLVKRRPPKKKFFEEAVQKKYSVYTIGLHMALVIFAFGVKRRMGEVLPVLDVEEFNRKMLMLRHQRKKELLEAAYTALRMLKGLDSNSFFRTYGKYAVVLGLPRLYL